MAAQYFGELGVNATNVGARDFDGGPNPLSVFAYGLQSYNVPLVATAINFTGTGTLFSPIIQVAKVNILGHDILIVGLPPDDLPFETKLPSGVSLQSDIKVAILNQIGQSKYVIMLSLSQSLTADVAYMNDLGLFVDVVIASYYTETMSNSDCVPGTSQCDQPYPYLGNTRGSNWTIAASPQMGQGMGMLTVTFDENGNLLAASGDPVVFNRTLITPDPAVEQDLADRWAVVEQFANVNLGYTPVALIGDGTNVLGPCRWTQCNLGSLSADALRHRMSTDIGFMEGGTIRANLSAGNFTLGEFLTAYPYLDNVASFQIQGSTLLDILNAGYSRVFAKNSGRFLQVSGLQVTWNPNINVTAGLNRVISVSVLNQQTGQYDLLDTTATYSVACTNYMFYGGDYYSLVGLPAKAINAFPYGPQVIDVIIDWIDLKANDESYWVHINDPRLIETTATEAFVPSLPIVVLHEVPDGLKAAFTVITGLFAIGIILVAAYFFWYGTVFPFLHTIVALMHSRYPLLTLSCSSVSFPCRHRDHAVTAIASLVFCMIIFAGLLLSLLSVMIFIHVENNGGCMTFPWLGNYAFVLIFASLFAKTWRLDRVFSQSKKLRATRRAISNQLLLGIVAIFLVVETFIMGLWQGLSPLKYELVVSGLDSRYACTSQYGIYYFAASIGYKGLLMVWGMYLVIKTRNIDSDFRESTFIGYIIYAVFFTIAIVFTVCLVMKTNPVATFAIMIVGFWMVNGTVIGALFVPKIIQIWTNPGLLWADYFQRRAEVMRQAQSGKSVFNVSVSVSVHDEERIQDRMRGLNLEALNQLLGELEDRRSELSLSLDSTTKDIREVRARILQKDPNAKLGASESSIDDHKRRLSARLSQSSK